MDNKECLKCGSTNTKSIGMMDAVGWDCKDCGEENRKYMPMNGPFPSFNTEKWTATGRQIGDAFMSDGSIRHSDGTFTKPEKELILHEDITISLEDMQKQLDEARVTQGHHHCFKMLLISIPGLPGSLEKDLSEVDSDDKKGAVVKCHGYGDCELESGILRIKEEPYMLDDQERYEQDNCKHDVIVGAFSVSENRSMLICDDCGLEVHEEK